MLMRIVNGFFSGFTFVREIPFTRVTTLSFIEAISLCQARKLVARAP